jgi:dTDP-glucose 4,6-dehydratase
MTPLTPSDADKQHVLEHTAGLWEPLRGQRVFITGGTGFFGAWLLQSFVWANEEYQLDARAVVLSRNWQAFRRKAPHLADHATISFHAGDVRDYAFPPGSFSHVIHAATEASVKLNTENPLLMLDTITAGTRRTLEFARQCGAARFLLVSSGAVYGRQPSDMTHIPEDHLGAPDPTSPASAYGEGKRLAEHLGVLYARDSGMEVKIARGFAFVGPYLPLDAHFAIGNFIRDALRGGPIVVQGDGTPYRSYLYAADLAIWLWRILFQGRTCRSYNVGSDVDLTISQLAHEVAACVAPEAEVRIALTPDRDKPPLRYVPDVRRARDELGLSVTVPLSEAICRTAAWQRRMAASAVTAPTDSA